MSSDDIPYGLASFDEQDRPLIGTGMPVSRIDHLYTRLQEIDKRVSRLEDLLTDLLEDTGHIIRLLGQQ